MHTGGGGGERGGRGAPHVPPIKIFEKLPHKKCNKTRSKTSFTLQTKVAVNEPSKLTI